MIAVMGDNTIFDKCLADRESMPSVSGAARTKRKESILGGV